MSDHPGFVVFVARDGNAGREGFVGRIAAPENKDKGTPYCVQLAYGAPKVAYLTKVGVAHNGAACAILVCDNGFDGGGVTQFEFQLDAKEGAVGIETEKTKRRLVVDHPDMKRIFAMFSNDNPWVAKALALEQP
jgi:hypothetical protein